MACGCNENPCNSSVTNTAACESLPSQIENFSRQFFGEVVKTEVDGQVRWSLPCNLDVGLPANPRGVDEGLACYFLRLFMDGIIGLQGDPGPAGADGNPGNNAYTVTLANFSQPSVGGNIVVLTAYNPAILRDLYVFIQFSGWYVVTDLDGTGILFLQLVKASPNAPAVGGTVPVGKLVVPSGFPGASIQGDQGVQGIQGEQGEPGESFTAENSYYHGAGGTNYDLTVLYAAVDFTANAPSRLLADPGKYLFTAVVEVVGLAGVALTDEAFFKFRNTSTSTDISGSEKKLSRLSQDEIKQVILNAIVETTGANESITIFGKATSGSAITTGAARTSVTVVRLE